MAMDAAHSDSTYISITSNSLEWQFNDTFQLMVPEMHPFISQIGYDPIKKIRHTRLVVSNMKEMLTQNVDHEIMGDIDLGGAS